MKSNELTSVKMIALCLEIKSAMVALRLRSMVIEMGGRSFFLPLSEEHTFPLASR